MPRTSRGRQKIEMTKMSKESNLLVTFSKRRSGLFKKASELCTLCGAEIAIIVFSPGKKVFSFGHPSLEAVLDRFLTRRAIPGNNNNNNATNASTTQFLEAHRNAAVRDLNMQLTHILNQHEIERKRGEDLSKMRKESAKDCWWEISTDELDLAEMEQVKAALENVKKTVAKQIEKLQIEGQGPTGGPYFIGAGLAGGGQTGVAYPPPQPFPQLPAPDMNAAELGLSLTPHGYTMGYGRGHQGF